MFGKQAGARDAAHLHNVGDKARTGEAGVCGVAAQSGGWEGSGVGYEGEGRGMWKQE